MRSFIIGLILSVFAFPALAQCPPGTITIERAAEFLNRYGLNDSRVLSPAAALKFTERFNAIPPVTSWKPETVVVYKNETHAIVVMHMGECAASPGPDRRAKVESMLRAIEPASL